MPTMDQVVWATCNVVTDGESVAYKRGDLLPEALNDQEAAARSLLRVGGALRVVEVVYTPEELAEMAMQRATKTADREAALDVDGTLPIGEQLPGTTQAGRPTLMEPSGGPVVLGDPDTKPQQDSSAAGAGGAGDPVYSGAVTVGAEDDDGQGSTGIVNPDDVAAPDRPASNASKATWVEYVVAAHDVSQEDAEGMTRDQLVAEYGSA